MKLPTQQSPVTRVNVVDWPQALELAHDKIRARSWSELARAIGATDQIVSKGRRGRAQMPIIARLRLLSMLGVESLAEAIEWIEADRHSKEMPRRRRRRRKQP